jgi:hypothetical protein
MVSSSTDDDTGINSVKLYCCRRTSIRPTKELDCNATAGWEVIAEHSNLGASEIKHGTMLKYGIQKTTGKGMSSHSSRTSDFENSWGIETTFTGQVPITVKKELKLKFDQKFKTSDTASQGSRTSYDEAYNEESTTSLEYTVHPRSRYILYQLVGQCGPVHVRTTRTRNEEVIFAPPERAPTTSSEGRSWTFW